MQNTALRAHETVTQFPLKWIGLCLSPVFGVWYIHLRGTAVAEWLMFCATDRKVAGSILACVVGIFH